MRDLSNERVLSSRWTKVAVFALCLVPVLLLGWRLLRFAMHGGQGYDASLTADPIDYITHYTGDWTIRFLLITLCVTPLRKLFGQPKLDALPPHAGAVRILLRRACT